MTRRAVVALSIAILGAVLVPAFADANGCYPAPEQVCNESPTPLAVPYDPNVFALNRMFLPESVTVALGNNINFQNTDSLEDHTVTDVGCVDGNPSTPCVFDEPLLIGSRGKKAVALVITPHDFSRKTYRYVCRVHPTTMKGSFTVV